MAFFVNQQVFRFQVTIRNVERVDVFERARNLGDVEQSHVVDEPAFGPEEPEKFSTSNVLKKQVNILVIFELAFHLDDKGVIHHHEHFALGLDVIYLLKPTSHAANYLMISLFLSILRAYGVFFLSLFKFGHDNSTEAASANSFAEIEVGKINGSLYQCVNNKAKIIIMEIQRLRNCSF